jgi:hypothetical protein
MKEQLEALLGSRSNSETKVLHDRLKEIRSAMNSNGVFTSSMHVNAAIRACSDYAEQYGTGAFDDYQRAISADQDKYVEEYLCSAAKRFLDRLAGERVHVQGILESSVGGVAKALSNTGLQEYKAFDVTWESVFQKAKAEVEIFNAGVLQTKPTFLSLFKEKWERQPLIVFLAGTSIALLFIAGILEAVQKIHSAVQQLLG